MRVAERYELASELRARYVAAGRRERGEILDAYCLATGYNRKYAIAVLRGRSRKPKPSRRPRAKRYAGQPFRVALALVWEASGYICAERLQPVLVELAQSLVRHRQLHMSGHVRSLLESISVSTLRRQLATMSDSSGWGRPRMRPATGLRSEVPVVLQNLQPFDEPGHLQIDLVSHSGRWATGEWIYTLCATDLCTGWTELEPVMSKDQPEVLKAIHTIHRRLPFPLSSLHIDNGPEFLNERLISYCRRHQVGLGRGRAHHKNDNAHVEQKNGYVVRRLLGDERLDSLQQMEWMRELFDQLRIYCNCFQPVVKRIGLVSRGDRVRRIHDAPRTPLARLIDSGKGHPDQVQRLLIAYRKTSPLTLKREIGRRLERRPPAVPRGRWPEAVNA
jgi:hypothetical protein